MGNERKGTLLPAMLCIPSVILVECIRVCISSWAQLYFYPVPAAGIRNIAQVHGSANPTLKRTKLSDHLLIHTLILTSSSLMCFSPFT